MRTRIPDGTMELRTSVPARRKMLENKPRRIDVVLCEDLAVQEEKVFDADLVLGS